MTEFKKALSERLKKLGKDREWLSGKIGISKHTIDNWFAPSKVMTEGNRLVIERILEKEEDTTYEGRDARKHARAYAVVFSPSEHERIMRAAAKLGRSVEDWSEEVLIAAAARVLHREGSLYSFEAEKLQENIAAEKEPRYGDKPQG